MDLPVKKRLQGEVYRSREKHMILNAFHYFNKTQSVSAAVKETSKAMGCSERYVYVIRTQQEPLKAPPKKKPMRAGQQKNTRVQVYNEQIQGLVRRKVHSFFLNIKNYIAHVKKVEYEMWRVDEIQDDVEQFLIRVNTDSSSSTLEDSSESSDI